MLLGEALNGSLRWYRRHQVVAGALFWLPTVFLYLVEQHGLATALRLQAVYYAAVVVCEVPSGWLSDRLGRVPTLRAVAACWLGAHLLFVASPTTVGLAGVVAAQILLAAGYACLSGTDVMLHFDTLEALGRADEFDEREAEARRGLLLTMAATALAGGAVGLVDLRLPFLLSLAAAGIQLVVSGRLVEPPRLDQGGATARTASPGHDLVAAVGHLGRRPLGWIGVYVLVQVVTVHLAGELTGPYLAEVLGAALSDPRRAALATGATAAAGSLIAAVAVRAVPQLARRLGVAATLLGAAVIPAGILVAMAAVTSLALLPVLALRGVQGAAASVLIPAVVGGHVERERRATFLSLLSLGGRLTYGAALLGLAAVAGTELGVGLSVAAGLAVALIALVVAAYVGLARGRIQLDHEHNHEHPAQTHAHAHVHLAGGRTDGHHDHRHIPPFVGTHHHEHEHQAVRHRHRHTADAHHRHQHGE